MKGLGSSFNFSRTRRGRYATYYRLRFADDFRSGGKEPSVVLGKTKHVITVQLRIHFPVLAPEGVDAILIFIGGASARSVYHGQEMLWSPARR